MAMTHRSASSLMGARNACPVVRIQHSQPTPEGCAERMPANSKYCAKDGKNGHERHPEVSVVGGDNRANQCFCSSPSLDEASTEKGGGWLPLSNRYSIRWCNAVQLVEPDKE
jgi:hypothetical protein